VSFVACALGGYAVLMALVQVRLIPVYRRLSFTPGAWSFTFAYAAAAADALTWLAIKKPPASTGYAIAVIAAHRLRLMDRLPHGGPGRPRTALSRPVTGAVGHHLAPNWATRPPANRRNAAAAQPSAAAGS